MANTYVLIASQVLGSNTASVTFSSIPSTYTDLIIKTSTRNSTTSSNVNINFNNDSGTTRWSILYLRGSSTTLVSTRSFGSNDAYIINATTSSGNYTSTFSNDEIYIPNYSTSSVKQISTLSTRLGSATATGLNTNTAGYYNTASVISTINLLPSGGVNFQTGSSFYLYGIKNS